MSTETESELWVQDHWTFRVRPPQADATPQPILLLIHGWTGNENSMWIFARRTARSAWKVAPRGPIHAPDGGYGWRPANQISPGRLADYQTVVDALLERVDRWANVRKCDSSLLDVMGFSQGAMMVYALGLLHPERIRLSAALAGYLPSPWLAERPLDRINNKAYFIAHGTQDDTFPVERARDTANQLKAAGAQVTYCEAPVGHKLDPKCLTGLENFFNKGSLATTDQGD